MIWQGAGLGRHLEVMVGVLSCVLVGHLIGSRSLFGSPLVMCFSFAYSVVVYHGRCSSGGSRSLWVAGL